MIQRQLKLQLTKRQEILLEEWLPILASIWNWAVRKIERDAGNGVYHNNLVFQNILSGHSVRLGVPSHSIQSVLNQVHSGWRKCFSGVTRKPKFKGRRNKLTNVMFPDPLKAPMGNHITLPGLGSVKFHGQRLPKGKIKCARLVKRASGWHLCLFIDAEPNTIPRVSSNEVGIDLGYTTMATLSDGTKIRHQKELQRSLKRIGQAQRGGDKSLAARLHERVANQKNDRNHKLSRKLVSENVLIAVSKDNLTGLARSGFGKSVSAAAHGQLRKMLAYKSRIGGSQYFEVPSKNSTRTCSECGALTGPSGLTGLKVRVWVCSGCGAAHDRDVNSARNALKAAVGATVERAA